MKQHVNTSAHSIGVVAIAGGILPKEYGTYMGSTQPAVLR